MIDTSGFLPITREEMDQLGWDAPDFVYVCGDAYVDHPSFGCAIICRVLENAGFRVAILSQPDYHKKEAFTLFGQPKLGFLVSAGNIDSMVAHYTVSLHKRTYDYYSPGGKVGLRPDRATVVYTQRIREAYGKDVPVILGGLEASLRRFAHYDYWSNKMRQSVLLESGADLLLYGMGEKIVLRVAELLQKGVPVHKIRDVRGTVWVGKAGDKVHFENVETAPWAELKQQGKAYADSFAMQYEEADSVRGRAVVEPYDDCILVQNPPMPPLSTEELDKVYELPYMREYHPLYEKDGGVPAITEVKFSLIHNRGCFGACHFCAIAFHQGREVRARSVESVVKEAKLLTEKPDFKGYIHDVGGPTANFRGPACDKQLKHGVCAKGRCLSPKPCPNLKVDHREYGELLTKIRELPKVKKVFIRSGIRFDYLLYDKNPKFFRQLVEHHISGQLKVAPEHCSDHALMLMGKPSVSVFSRFKKRYYEECEALGKKQYLVPYLMSSHPGTTLEDAVDMAVWLRKEGIRPEQVQDFYPTPGTVSTVMYATGLNPLTGEQVYVAKTPKEKHMQRALLQSTLPQNRGLVLEALKLTGKENLIGYAKYCLLTPDKATRQQKPAQKPESKPLSKGKPHQKKTGNVRGTEQKLKSKGKPSAASRYSPKIAKAKSSRTTAKSTPKGQKKKR